MGIKRRIKYKTCDKIDIGCKTNTKKDHIGIDIKDFGQNIVWDVTEGLPFPDNSVSSIYSSHFLEHISNENLEDLIFEILRVAKNGTEITIKVPHSSTIESKYLCHLSLWDEGKVKGIVRGLGSSKQRFEILSIGRSGIELNVRLKVIK